MYKENRDFIIFFPHYKKRVKMKKTLLAGVVGFPLYHTKSPLIHNYWLNKYNIKGYYIPLEVKPNNLKDSLQSLINLGFKGVNITIPHKVNVLSFADTITDRAAIIGAANTLFFNSDGKIRADNTDSFGFIKSIYDKYPNTNFKEEKAIVFGAGGASRAVIHSLLSEGISEVYLINRTKEKAKGVAEELGARVKVLDWNVNSKLFKDISIVINSTSLGMKGNSSFHHNIEDLKKNSLLVDLIYDPQETSFLKKGKELGYKTLNGIGMLMNQAKPGFEGWFGVKPNIDEKLKKIILNG